MHDRDGSKLTLATGQPDYSANGQHPAPHEFCYLRFGLTRSGLVGDVFDRQAERMPSRVGVDAPVIVGLDVVSGRACR